MFDWLSKLLDPEVLSDLVGVAVQSGTAFYAVICLLIGVALVNIGPNRFAKIAGAFLLGISGVMMLYTTFGPTPATNRYTFVIHDKVRAGSGPVTLEAEHGSDVWLKSKDDQRNYRALALWSEKVPRSEQMWLVVRDSIGTLSRVDFHRCDIAKPVYGLTAKLAEAEHNGEGEITYSIEPPDGGACAPRASAGWFAGLAAHAQVRVEQIGKSAPSLFSTTDIVLKYYTKDADDGAVAEAVEDFERGADFVLDTKISQVPINITAHESPSRSQDLPTNAVWYGTDVPVEVAGKLAASLVAGGVELRYFGPYVRSDTRINTIEAGHSTLQDDSPVLSLEDIQSATCEKVSQQDCADIWANVE